MNKKNSSPLLEDASYLISLILDPPLPIMQPMRSLGIVISCVCAAVLAVVVVVCALFIVLACAAAMWGRDRPGMDTTKEQGQKVKSSSSQ